MEFPDRFSDETKRVLSIWHDIVQKKHQDDEDYSDPLLVIEYNQQGLIDRNITKQVELGPETTSLNNPKLPKLPKPKLFFIGPEINFNNTRNYI